MSSIKNGLLIAENYIGGKFEVTASLLDSYEPSTGKVWAQIPDSDAADVNKAVEAALKGFQSWKRLSVKQRSKYLLDAADLMEARLDEFALMESRDQVCFCVIAKILNNYLITHQRPNVKYI